MLKNINQKQITSKQGEVRVNEHTVTKEKNKGKKKRI